jgi:hypothetical protein
MTGAEMIFNSNLKSERRRRNRQVLNTSVEIFTGSSRMDAFGINVTDVGMCLFTAANLAIGSQIEVEFLPPRSPERVRISGIVRHRAVYLYGIEFVVSSDVHPGRPADQYNSFPASK